jgi:hypothetical protein
MRRMFAVRAGSVWIILPLPEGECGAPAEAKPYGIPAKRHWRGRPQKGL